MCHMRQLHPDSDNAFPTRIDSAHLDSATPERGGGKRRSRDDGRRGLLAVILLKQAVGREGGPRHRWRHRHRRSHRSPLHGARRQGLHRGHPGRGRAAAARRPGRRRAGRHVRPLRRDVGGGREPRRGRGGGAVRRAGRDGEQRGRDGCQGDGHPCRGLRRGAPGARHQRARRVPGDEARGARHDPAEAGLHRVAGQRGQRHRRAGPARVHGVQARRGRAHQERRRGARPPRGARQLRVPLRRAHGAVHAAPAPGRARRRRAHGLPGLRRRRGQPQGRRRHAQGRRPGGAIPGQRRGEVRQRAQPHGGRRLHSRQP